MQLATLLLILLAQQTNKEALIYLAFHILTCQVQFFVPEETSTDNADRAIWQRLGLLWTLCFTKPNKNDTAPKETASSAKAPVNEKSKRKISNTELHKTKG